MKTALLVLLLCAPALVHAQDTVQPSPAIPGGRAAPAPPSQPARQAAPRARRSGNAFVPSEKVSADSVVSFPVDI
jgi:hypothetical protein